MMLPLSFRAAGAAGALIAVNILAGCAGGASPLDTTVTRSDVMPNYEPISVSVFAGSGGHAVIEGATRDGASAEAIAASIRLPAHVAPRTIRAASKAERQSGPHLVLVFAPKSGTTSGKACRGEAEGGQAGDDVLTVFGVFCSSYGTPVSDAVLTLKGSPTPSDPNFQHRMSFLMNTVMPPFNPDRDSRPRLGG